MYGKPRYDSPEFDKAFRMKQNLSRFAGVKSAWQTKHLKDAKPQQRPAIDNTYNNNWMRTEYVHTVRSARAAKNWQRYEADKDLYPYLEYTPSTAAEPRNEHKRLYGVTKPLDDPFWDMWMPPSDWGCKCGVQQRRNDANATEPPKDIKKPPAAMRNNPGKTGEIITAGHPMFKKMGKNTTQNVTKETKRLEGQLSRSEAAQYAKENLLNKTYQTHDGRTLSLTGGGLNKMLSQGSQYFIRFLPDIIKNMKPYKPAESPSKGRRNIKLAHFYKHETQNHIIKTVVWEMKGKETDVLHSMSITEKNKP